MRDGTLVDSPIRQTVGEAQLEDGRSLPVTSMRLRREATGGFPGEMSGTAGFTAGQADVTAQPDRPIVQRRGPSPLTSPDALAVGRMCSLTIGEESSARHQVGRMLVRDATGKATDPSMQLTLSDDLADLDTPVWLEPLLSAMPAVNESGANRRDVALWNTAVYHRVLRAAGRSAAPHAWGAWIDAPMVGTVWPEAGVAQRAGLHTSSVMGTIDASHRDDRHHMIGGQVIWQRWQEQAWNDAGLVIEAPPQDAGESSTVWVTDAAETAGYRVEFSAGSVALYSGAGSLLGSAPFTGGRLLVEVYGVSGTWTVRMVYPGGEVAAPLGAPSACDRMIWRSSQRGRLGALWLGPRDRAALAYASRPTAVLHMNYSDMHALRAMPSLLGVQAGSVISDQAAAECARVWVDGDNVLHVAGPRWWATRPVARVLTAENDLHDWSWQRTSGGLPRPIRIDGRKPAITTSPYVDVTLWEAEGMSLTDPDTVEEWVKPGDDEDWIMVSTQFRSPHLAENAWLVNKGRESLAGGHLTNDADGTVSAAAWSESGHDLRRVGPQSWLWTATWQKPPADTTVALAIHPRATNVAEHLRGSPLPKVRGRGRTSWSDGELHFRDASPAPGQAVGSTLVHDVQWHVQSETALSSLADLIGQRAEASVPIVSGVDIAPDWRLEVADTVLIRDSTTSVELRCVITELDEAADESSGSQALAVDVLAATSLGATYGDDALVHSNDTYSTAAKDYAGMTYGQVEGDPIGPARPTAPTHTNPV